MILPTHTNHVLRKILKDKVTLKSLLTNLFSFYCLAIPFQYIFLALHDDSVAV